MFRSFTYTLLMCTLLPGMSIQAFADDHYQQALSSWSRTLQRFVDTEGRTDFKALAGQPGDLQDFVSYVATSSPETDPDLFPTPADKLSYYINAYNALAMQGVIDENIPENFDSFFKRAAFFKFRKITIGKQKTSLYDLENKVIRALNEPRVHFALNCMVRDCPRLPRQPFRAETLETQLQTLTREFFSKQKHIRIDHEKRILFLSSILDFYTEDFVASGKAADLVMYVNAYLDQPLSQDYRVRFIKYDWTVNQQAE